MKIIQLSLLVISSSILFCSIRIEGFYDAQFGKTYESDLFEWNMWNPNYHMETRFYSSPIKNSDLYFKFYSDKDFESSNKPFAIFSEGHIGFREDRDNRGFSAVLFSRESRHYWYDGSLLGIINTGSVNNDGNGQGLRLDGWHQYDGSLTYVFSDFSQGSGDDVHLLRYRQSLMDSKIKTGIFFQKKNYSSGGIDDYNQIIAGDLKFYLDKYFINSELAISKVPSDTIVSNINHNYEFKDIIKSNIAIKSELKGFRAGSEKYGYWFINPGFFSYGNTYRNYMGDNQSNKFGHWINSHYLIPNRAITLVLNYSYSQKIVPDTISVFTNSIQLKEIYNKNNTLYSEVYLEFVNGFKGKIAFNKSDNNWQGVLYKHYDFFTELSVENSLAKLLAQFKVKDLGEVWEKHITGLEISVNLAEKWKFFTRGMIINDRVGSRYSFFTEIQYRNGGNSELYLQYGPSNWGQYGLVNDDGFASSGVMKKEVKLILKGWF